MIFAKGRDLSTEAVTQTLAFLGKRGSGKTYAAMRLAESMLAEHAQVVVIDPVGKAWSLRLAADGKGPGFEIPILGGHRADLPLAPTAGAVVADLVVDKAISCVLDVSLFSKADRKRFVTAFAERLFDRKKAQLAPSPVHLVIEEAQVFVPQRADPGEFAMLGAFEDLVRLGRNFGIGASLISQRPQSVSKEVLNQTECLVVLQTVGPHERKALGDWMREQDPGRLAIVNELPSLEPGEAYLWSPGWLRTFERVRIRKRQTFDASATPTVGAQRSAAAPRTLTGDELADLSKAMGDAVEAAGANDPTLLRVRIRKLEAELAARPPEPPSPAELARAMDAARASAREQIRTEVAIAVAHLLEQLDPLGKSLERLVERVVEMHRDYPGPGQLPAPRTFFLNGAHELPRGRKGRAVELPAAQVLPRADPGLATPGAGESRSLGDLAGAQRKILEALAELGALGLDAPPRVQVALFAGYTHLRSKGFSNAIGALRTAGLIDYPAGGTVALTAAGEQAAGRVAAPRDQAALSERLYHLVGPASMRVLAVLLDQHGEPLERTELMNAAGYTHARSKGFSNTLGRLHSLGLVTYPARGQVAAADVCFHPGGA